MSQRQCYECKGYGHLSYDCPNKRNGERRDGEGSQRSEGGYRPERSRRSNSPVPTAPNTPDAMVLDTTSADDPYEARFQKIEGDVQGIRTDTTSINTRMGTMTGDIISALRADRAAERPAEASSGPEPSTGTQPAFGTTTTPSASPSYMFMRRPKDIPFDMGPAPVDAWAVVKEGDDGRQRRAVKVMIPALPTDRSA